MVHIYCVIITENNNVIQSAFELSEFGYFQRSSIEDLCLFIGKECIKRGILGKVNTFEKDKYICYSFNKDNKGYTCVCDLDYPSRIAIDFLNKIVGKQYTKIELINLLVDYQNINQIDKISAIQKELEETTKICHDTINKLLIREEELIEIMNKSDDLRFQTKILVNETDKLNSCCNIL